MTLSQLGNLTQFSWFSLVVIVSPDVEMFKIEAKIHQAIIILIYLMTYKDQHGRALANRCPVSKESYSEEHKASNDGYDGCQLN